MTETLDRDMPLNLIFRFQVLVSVNVSDCVEEVAHLLSEWYSNVLSIREICIAFLIHFMRHCP